MQVFIHSNKTMQGKEIPEYATHGKLVLFLLYQTRPHNTHARTQRKEKGTSLLRRPDAGRWRLSCSPSARVLRQTSTHTPLLISPRSFSFRSHSLASPFFALSPSAPPKYSHKKNLPSLRAPPSFGRVQPLSANRGRTRLLPSSP